MLLTRMLKKTYVFTIAQHLATRSDNGHMDPILYHIPDRNNPTTHTHIGGTIATVFLKSFPCSLPKLVI